MTQIDYSSVETPCYIVDLGLLRKNLELLARVQREAECKILLALKGFAMWSTFPVIREYLSGIAASSPSEAQLGREEFGKEVHAYAPAYSERDIRELVRWADHLVFNSVRQYRDLAPLARQLKPSIECGLRVNPEHSEGKVALYDPCAPRSRLGAIFSEFEAGLKDGSLAGLDGLHFHALCEQNSDVLERMLAAVEAKFGAFISNLKWVNFGGGHHITRPDYEVDRLIRIVTGFKQRHGKPVYLEPGEAIALNTGVLVSSVLDLVENQGQVAILDTSATAHMPDVLEMPYRPNIAGGAEPGKQPYTYRLGGLTCLAGDVIGDYSFVEPLKIGQKLVFGDMAHYTMVKNTTFNGVQLPSIATFEPQTGELKVVRRFGYQDYKSRLS
jgi:carboxynorspermidine decarboxylase